MEILLQRHGVSKANLDNSHYLEVADHAVSLDDEGLYQADASGAFAASWVKEHWGDTPFRIWHSPYLRSRQTTDGLVSGLRNGGVTNFDVREHILLAEQQFGLFDGLTDEELQLRYPDEHEHYERCRAHGGRFWARMPLGESRFDVAQRVHQSFGTFQRDAQRHGLDRIIISAHGTTIRAFVMMWMHLDVDWFEKEPNPANCSFRLISGDVDHGYVFPGFTSNHKD